MSAATNSKKYEPATREPSWALYARDPVRVLMSHRRETSSRDVGSLKNVYHSIWKDFFAFSRSPVSFFCKTKKKTAKYQQISRYSNTESENERKKEDKREWRKEKKYYESKSQRRVAPTKEKKSKKETNRNIKKPKHWEANSSKNFNSFAAWKGVVGTTM